MIFLDDPFADYLVPMVVQEIWNPGDDSHPGKTHPRYYGVYAELARQLRPTSILEFGVRYGYSAAAMLSAVPHANYFGVDDERDLGLGSLAAAGSVLQQHGFPQVRVIVSDTCRPGLEDELPKCDLVHVDGSHIHAYEELCRADDCLNDDGVIVLDDAGAEMVWQGLRRFLSERPTWAWQQVVTLTGWMLLRRWP